MQLDRNDRECTKICWQLDRDKNQVAMFKWLSLVLLLCFLYYIREVFPPFILGGIIAYLLLPNVNRLSSWTRMDMRFAVLIIYSLFLVLGALVFWKFGSKVAEQFTALVNQRQEIVINLLNQVSTAFHWQIDVDKESNDILKTAEQTFGQPTEIVHLGGLLSRGMLSLLVCVVSSIYFIVDSKRVGQFFLRFIPEKQRNTTINLSEQMNLILSKYVEGQLILIALMGCVAYFFLHFVFHLKYALLIAILSGFLEIIPVLGPILATTTATLVGVAQYGFNCALGIILCYTLARWAEDYIIIPGIIGHAVKLHPLAVIFAVLCGETMAGPLGMLIAIPVAASIKVVIDFYYPALNEETLVG
jgi:predicted PurR-regulated permease PerM